MLNKVRTQFLDFFLSKGHKVIDSYSIIPKNDPTLLFINSGMAPLKRCFLQEQIPPAARVVNSQRCLRVGGKHNDLADVGYTKRHHTFFEMLGNFSFGDYFQQEAIAFAWEFLTQSLSLDAKRLYITTHPEDEAAFDIWSKIIDKSRIFKLSENVWSMGLIGPFGYCSEIFYDLTPSNENIDLNNGDRFLEIWNLVFMQFYNDGINTTKLAKPCIDAGMGLERLVSVIEGKQDTYDISFFIQALEFLHLQSQTTNSKIFLDHLRAVAMMISEGVIPGPGSREYVLRRLLRRLLKAYFDDFSHFDLKIVARSILNMWQKEYSFQLNIDNICNILEKESLQFQNVINDGMSKFEEFLAATGTISPYQMFLLHDTYGLSSDIVADTLKARGVTCDVNEFEKIMDATRDKNRRDAKIVLPYQATVFIDDPEIESEIIGFYEEYIILDRTPFYAESGGQVGDIGEICALDGSFKLKIGDTQKIGDVFVHRFIIEFGSPILCKVRARINNEVRRQIRAHHSCTHLLFAAVAKICGEDIKQMGSFVADTKLRIDLNISPTEEQLTSIELLVNSWIQENHPVNIVRMKYDEAVAAGAQAFFSYGDMVRVVKMGDVSMELCGGTHVNALGDIGLFKIIKVSSIGAGVKRIEGCCAQEALRVMQCNACLLKEITEYLGVGYPKNIMQKLFSANKQNKKTDIVTKKISEYSIGYCNSENINIKHAMIENSLDVLLVIVEKEKKMSLKLQIGDRLPLLNAAVIVQEIGMLINAQGYGGNKNYAQTGGTTLIDHNVLFGKLVEYISNNI
jgi:alanyl-tRNA synthetase